MFSRLLKLKGNVEINGVMLQLSYNLWTGVASISYGGVKVEKVFAWNGGEINISNIKVRFKGYLNPYAEIYVNNVLYARINSALKFKAKRAVN